MKILNVIQCTNLGGMEQYVLLFMDELKKLGIESEVLSLNRFGELKALLDARGISARDLSYRGYGGWRSFWQARRMMQSIRADGLLMSGHNLMAFAAMGRLCKGKRALFIHYHHRNVKPDWAWRIIYRLAAKRFRAIIFASSFIRDEAVDIVPALAGLSRVIYYPFPLPELPTDKTRMAARQSLGIASDALVIGNAGWLIPRKRWDIFIDVAGKVASRVPQARFLIAGDGPQREAMEARASAQGIQNRIHWLGWQKDLTDFFHSLDVMLFNSDWDAMGRTPLEAMAYGIPTVASVTHGGLREILDDSRYAFFSPTHNVVQLADAVVRLLNDREAARVLGLAGRGRIKEVGNPKIHTLRVLKTMGFKLSDIPNQDAVKAFHEADFNLL
ncbi:MAG: glycosyltransferase family 4 protein [Methylacidiphilales bacterium]|nr:glycosyltransferase family 4 protein [Candidatus Methylacidiphilales bacterium]